MISFPKSDFYSQSNRHLFKNPQIFSPYIFPAKTQFKKFLRIDTNLFRFFEERETNSSIQLSFSSCFIESVYRKFFIKRYSKKLFLICYWDCLHSAMHFSNSVNFLILWKKENNLLLQNQIHILMIRLC